MERRKAEFQAHVDEALRDNVLTDDELHFLSTLKDDMGISEAEFDKLLRRMEAQKTKRSSGA